MALPIRLQLPPGFLDAEVRCGYEVSTKLKKIWAVELDLMTELLRVCEKHNLRIHVAYGSIIGAVRHKGFIPWDDDMDVWLPRKDYDKLCEIAPQEFAHPYFLQTPLSDRGCFSGFSRFRNSLTTAYITDQPRNGYNHGIFIDVYPMDAAPVSRVGDLIQTFLQRTVVRCARLNRGNIVGKTRTKRFVARILSCIPKLIPYTIWTKLYHISMTWRKNKGLYAPLFSLSAHEKQIRVSERDFDEPQWCKFENIEVPVPRNYDEILTVYYGDYKKFPPVEDRGKWHEGQIRFDPDMNYHEWFRVHPEGS